MGFKTPSYPNKIVTNMIEKLKNKDYKNFLSFCSEKNVLKDVKTRKRVFNNCLKRSDLCLLKKENEEITSVLIVYKKDDRKYLKLISSSFTDTKNLFQALKWENIKNLTIIANKKDRSLVYFNKKFNEYRPSYYLKFLNFTIEKDIGNKIIFTNKE